MSSHICLRVHFVWSTAHREPWIDPAWVQRLYAYLGTNSSRWVHQTVGRPSFAWQAGYGAFSVSVSSDGQVRKYLANQAGHHQRRSFQEEYLDFLDRHGVAYDPRYVLA